MAALFVCGLNLIVAWDQAARALPSAMDFLNAMNAQKQYIAPGLNLVAIVAFVVAFGRRFPLKEKDKQSGYCFDWFRDGWSSVVLLWGLIYIFKLVLVLGGHLAPEITTHSRFEGVSNIISNGLNNAQDVALIQCYYILAQPRALELIANRSNSGASPVWPIGLLCVVLLAVAQLLCEFMIPDPEAARNGFALTTYLMGGACNRTYSESP